MFILFSPFYSGTVKMDANDKADSHNDKINDNSTGAQQGGTKSTVNSQENDNKEEVNQQNEWFVKKDDVRSIIWKILFTIIHNDTASIER